MMHLYCTVKRLKRYRRFVLILVVMDDALVLANQLQLNPQAALVLILVVMDDALVLSTTLLRKTIRLQRLNPCCNG